MLLQLVSLTNFFLPVHTCNLTKQTNIVIDFYSLFFKNKNFIISRHIVHLLKYESVIGGEFFQKYRIPQTPFRVSIPQRIIEVDVTLWRYHSIDAE